MRRQSSQASTGGANNSSSSTTKDTVNLAFDDENSVVVSPSATSPISPGPATLRKNAPAAVAAPQQPPVVMMIGDTAYGDPTQDAGDEVRFSVELTRIDRLSDTFSLDIRRLKGNLRSYKFLYDTIRQ
jgi:protein-serine/threonine kinase